MRPRPAPRDESPQRRAGPRASPDERELSEPNVTIARDDERASEIQRAIPITRSRTRCSRPPEVARALDSELRFARVVAPPDRTRSTHQPHCGPPSWRRRTSGPGTKQTPPASSTTGPGSGAPMSPPASCASRAPSVDCLGDVVPRQPSGPVTPSVPSAMPACPIEFSGRSPTRGRGECERSTERENGGAEHRRLGRGRAAIRGCERCAGRPARGGAHLEHNGQDTRRAVRAPKATNAPGRQDAQLTRPRSRAGASRCDR